MQTITTPPLYKVFRYNIKKGTTKKMNYIKLSIVVLIILVIVYFNLPYAEQGVIKEFLKKVIVTMGYPYSKL